MTTSKGNGPVFRDKMAWVRDKKTKNLKTFGEIPF